MKARGGGGDILSFEITYSLEQYRQLCDNEPSIPLFSQAWWLDAVAGPTAWGVVLVSRGGQVMGAHPYVFHRRRGQTWLTQSNLSQTLGPWLRPSENRESTRLAAEKDILGVLADSLPVCDGYRQNWHYSLKNWLPFYWRGYQQSTNYTYRLDLTLDEDKLWRGMNSNIRGDIRKAQKRFGVKVRHARELGEFLAVNRKTFERQGKSVPYTSELVEQLDTAAAERHARDILLAEDDEGNIHAGAYFVRDATTVYYLMGGGNPVFRNSGSGSLCLWEAFRSQPAYITAFDFEGSMLETVERFFRAFGAEQVPYFQVTKTFTRLAWLEGCLVSMLKRRQEPLHDPSN